MPLPCDLPVFPSWARLEAPVDDLTEAGYRAGAALGALSARVHADAPWAGVWRRRLALKAAAASIRMVRRGEDETQLRDAFYLRQSSDDAGPAGHILIAWRVLDRSTPLEPEASLHAAREFGVKHDAALDDAIAAVQKIAGGPQSTPFAAGAAASLVMQGRPDAELLALWFADAVLAARLRWPIPLPLLAGALPSLRRNARTRPQPTDSNWQLSCILAYARAAAEACDLFADLGRRAEKLFAVAPKLRAKGAAAVIARLLEDDAIASSSAIAGISERGLRRLCDRLVALGGVRELTERASFRLYGL